MKKIINDDDAYITYKSVHNQYLNTKADVFIGNHVPMNSISAGHPIIGKPIGNVQEARRLMWNSATRDLEIKSQEQKGSALTKKLVPSK